ncbi:MAG: heavy metal-associated domain-containing protein [Bacteroidia bacterium]
MQILITNTYHVSGMSCGGCAATVKNKLSAVQGITSVKVDLENNELEVTSSEAIKIDTLKDALNNTSYTISELKS